MSVLLVGCNKETKPAKPQQNQGETKQLNDNKTATTAPLTGLAEKVKNQRAVAVVLNNHHLARPQSGLSEADIVYEALAEGHITRLLAIFQSKQPVSIGPVRSARDYFIDLAKGYNSFFVAHGYSPKAKKMLQSNVIDNINGIQYDGTLFKRDATRQAPHNSYITYEHILKGAKLKQDNMSTSPAPLSFYSQDKIKSIDGSAATTISITYAQDKNYNPTYKYNKQTHTYDRYEDTVQTIDRNNDQPVTVNNLFIIVAKHSIIDGYGRRAIDLTSGGTAYVFQNGTYKKVTWKNKDGRIIPYDQNGPVKWVPGKTWINIVPTAQNVSWST